MAAQVPATQVQIRQELSRVLASPQFAESPRLSRFLSYVVEKTLADESEQIKEYSIGLAVFDRSADFDPRIDTIVRVQASKMRSRLAEYYALEGATNALKVQLPKGSYVPVFASVESNAVSLSPELRGKIGRNIPIRGAGIAALALAVAFGAGFVYAIRFKSQPTHLEAIRFVVSAPGQWAFRGYPQISPDGRAILTTVFKDGQAATYLHSLVSGSGALVPGTMGALAPYWSADGKSFLFTVAGQLKRIDLGGSGPMALTQKDSSFGADWSGNTILLGDNPGPIWRVPVSGGPSSPVTRLQKTQMAHVFPCFLPDGNRFLYLALGQRPPENAIYVASLDGKLNRRLMQSETKAQFIPEAAGDRAGWGYLLFVRAGNLLAQRLDLKTLSLGEEPRQLATGVAVRSYGASGFSASANAVVYYEGFGGIAAQFTWFDRTGRMSGVLGPVGDLGDPVISPDGKRVAYDLGNGANRDIWTTEVNSGKTSRITFDPQVDHCPVWSPDARNIAFESHRSTPGLYITSAAAGGAETLILPSGDAISDWSADGRFLIFSAMRTLPDKTAIWMLPVSGESKPVRWPQSEGNERQPVLSVDGKWVAYVSDESGQNNIYVRPFNAGPVSGPKWQISTNGGTQPAWRSDGKELFYLSLEGVLMAAGVRTGVVFDYEKPVPLFDIQLRVPRGPRNDYATRDGKHFLVRVPAQTSASPIHVIANWSGAMDN